MGRAKVSAEVASGAMILLAVATTVIALTGSLRSVFAGRLSVHWTLVSAAVFLSAGVGLALRRAWGWYWSLAVASGFAAVGLAQISAGQRLGIATMVVAIALVLSIVRASPWFPGANVREDDPRPARFAAENSSDFGVEHFRPVID